MANVTKELVLNETFMSTEQTPRNVADILADELENIASAIEGGSGSGGHIIQDASGTDLAQEPKLQFGGMLKTTDDSENGVTKVSDLAEEVEWSVWNAMTEAQRTAYSAGKKIDILHAPSVQDNKVPKTDIATVESGSTASKNYSVGELVYVNGNLYKVITAIASGATFTVGTNVEVTNVSNVLSGIDSAVTVKQTANTSVNLRYDSIVGYAQDTNKPFVTIPFPFFTKNTNYTANVVTWTIDGVGVPTNINVINKNNNSLALTGTATMSYLKICPSSISVTITFA